jgi:hypothetical protein
MTPRPSALLAGTSSTPEHRPAYFLASNFIGGPMLRVILASNFIGRPMLRVIFGEQLYRQADVALSSSL